LVPVDKPLSKQLVYRNRNLHKGSFLEREMRQYE
jgi:hypothetical protein